MTPTEIFEAGRGFSVVAAEAKSLAGRTGRATEEIRSQIGLIQDAVGLAGETAGAVLGISRELGTRAGELDAAIRVLFEQVRAA